MAGDEDDAEEPTPSHRHDPEGGTAAEQRDPSAGPDPEDPDEAPDGGDGSGEPEETPEPPADGPPPEYYYEEVTLADLAITLWDHRRAAVAVLAAVVLGTAAFTAAAAPTYEATATMVPFHQQDVILAVLTSDHYAAHVAEELGLVGELGDGNARRAGQALQSQVEVSTGSRQVGGAEEQVIRVTASSSDPSRAAEIADAYVQKADWARSLLENATYDRYWKEYYEGAGQNATRAQANLTALVQGYRYFRPLDTASAPSEPVSPDWQLNLALGGTLGAMLAFMTPFVVEAAANVRAELRQRRDV